MLERGRQREVLAQMIQRLVDGEAGADRGELEEHAARLAEVDRAEVEAIDHRRRSRAGADHPLAPGLVVLHGRRKGDVVDRAGALDAGLGRRAVVGVGGPAALTAHLPAVARPPEAERLLEQGLARLRLRRVRAHAVEPLERHLARNLDVLGDQRVVARLVYPELVLEALRVAEPKPAVDTLRCNVLATQAVGPEADGVRRAHSPDDPVDHPVTGAARRIELSNDSTARIEDVDFWRSFTRRP